MLPSVSPLTSSPKKRLQFTGRRRSHKRVRPTWSRGPHSLHLGPGRLPDADEHSVDRVVDAERLLHHVAVLVETDRKAEQRGLLRDLRLLDLRPDLGTARRPVLARPVDRTDDDLRRDVARRAEELRVASVDLCERLDPLVLRVEREERVVDVRAQTRERGIEESVRAHQLDAPAAEALHLLAERLALRRQLPRQVDDVDVARDLVDDRREVGLLLADAVTSDRDALGLQLLLHLVGEPDAVGLLVVDDVDVLRLQLADHVGRDAHALRRVRRDRTEEEARARSVERDLRIRRGARDEAEAGTLERTGRGLHLVRPGRTDDAEHARVRAECLRALDRLGRPVGRAEHRVLVHELDLGLVRLVVGAPEVVRPVHLIDPDRRGRAREGRHQPDRARLAALDECRVARRRGGRRRGTICRCGRCRNGRECGERKHSRNRNCPSPHTNSSLGFHSPSPVTTLCDETPAYLLSSYTRFAGESEGWNTPRMCMGSGPTFSMQCTFSGGKWKQEPGRSGMDWPPTWATPSPFTMYPSSSYGWLWKGALLGWTIPMNCVTSRQPASSLIRYRKVRSTEAVSSGWSSKRTVTLRLSPATGSSARAATATTSSSPGPGLSTEYLSPGATKTLVPGSSAWRLPSSSSSPRPATTESRSWRPSGERSRERPAAKPIT